MYKANEFNSFAFAAAARCEASGFLSQPNAFLIVNVRLILTFTVDNAV